MLKHVVMWRFLDSSEKAKDVQKAKDMLLALPTKIPMIQGLEVGINEIPGDRASDLVLYSVFNSRHELKMYQEHPAHVELAGFLKNVVSEARAVDFED